MHLVQILSLCRGINIALGIDSSGKGLTLRSDTMNGRAVRCTGNNQQVGFVNLNQLDSSSLWTFGGGGPYVAVRPLANDDQNLNVRGGCAQAAPICTWTWSGGDPNEIWAFIRL